MNPDQNPARVAAILRFMIDEMRKAKIETISINTLEEALDKVVGR